MHRKGKSGGTKPGVEEHSPAAREDRRPRPPRCGPAGCRGCGTAVRGAGLTPRRAPPARAQRLVSPRSRPGREARGERRPGSARPPGRAPMSRSILPRAGRARRPPRCGPGGCRHRLSRTGPTPPRGAHPSVRSSRSRLCWPSVRQPRWSGAGRTGAAPWPGRARRSTGSSRPGAAPGRAAAAEQAGKRSSRLSLAAAPQSPSPALPRQVSPPGIGV